MPVEKKMENESFQIGRIKKIIRTYILTPLLLIMRNKTGFAGFVVLILLILMTLIGPYFIPLDTETKPLNQRFLPPSWEHPLGTDLFGRDILSQIVNGGSIVLAVGFLTGFFTVVIATILGMLAGFKGGFIDSFIMYLADVILTIPQFPLLAVLAGMKVMRFSDPVPMSFLLGILSWPSLSRAIRSQVMSLKHRDFIEAARALDLGTRRIIFSEIMPNMMSYIAVSYIFAMTGAVYAQVGLVVLGFVPFAAHNWGVMINRAWTYGTLYYRPSVFHVVSPIVAIAILQTSSIMFTRSLEAIFNPRLRQRE